jgi:hypothetical protein
LSIPSHEFNQIGSFRQKPLLHFSLLIAPRAGIVDIIERARERGQRFRAELEAYKAKSQSSLD